MERKGLDVIIKTPDELKHFVYDQMYEIRNELLQNKDANLTIARVIGNLTFKASDIVEYFDECNELFLGLGMAYELMYDIAELADLIKDTKVKEIAYNTADRIYNSI